MIGRERAIPTDNILDCIFVIALFQHRTCARALLKKLDGMLGDFLRATAVG